MQTELATSNEITPVATKDCFIESSVTEAIMHVIPHCNYTFRWPLGAHLSQFDVYYIITVSGVRFCSLMLTSEEIKTVCQRWRAFACVGEFERTSDVSHDNMHYGFEKQTNRSKVRTALTSHLLSAQHSSPCPYCTMNVIKNRGRKHLWPHIPFHVKLTNTFCTTDIVLGYIHICIHMLHSYGKYEAID